MNSNKKIFAVFFTVIAAMLMNITAFAMDGNGTKQDPYIIKNTEDYMCFLRYEDYDYYFKLGADVDISVYAGNILKNKNNKYLDLNGYTLSGDRKGFPLLYVNTGTLTITDSSGNDSGCIEAVGTSLGCIEIKDDGNVVIDGGMIKSSVEKTNTVKCKDDSSLIINGGIVGEISAVKYSHITINGGTVRDFAGMNSVRAEDDAVFEMNGGITEIMVGASDNAKIRIYGGTVKSIALYTNSVFPESVLENCTVKSGAISTYAPNGYTLSDFMMPCTSIMAGGEEADKYVSYINCNKEIQIVTPYKKVIRELSLYAKPMFGQTPNSFQPVVLNGSSPYVKFDDGEYFMWFKDGNKMANDEEFTVKHNYKVQMWVKTKSSDYAFYVDKNHDPAVTATVNGETAVVYKAYEQDPYEVIEVAYDFGYCDYNSVKNLLIYVDIPREGDTPDFDPALSANCVFKNPSKGSTAYWYNGIRWYDASEGMYMTPDDKFVKGHDYVLEVNIVPDEFSVFNISSAYINNHSVEVWGGSEVRLEYTFKEGLKGDVDKNGFVEEADAELLMEYVTGIEPVLSELQLEAAKVTDGGKDKPDMLDVIRILQIAENNN